VIVTDLPPKKDRKRQTASEIALRRGLAIFRGISCVIQLWRPVVVAQEAAAGSKSQAAAQGLARAQQACGDAIYRYLGAMPIFITPQRNQKTATGKRSCSKDEMKEAMRDRWSTSDFDDLLRTRPPYAGQGQRLPPPSKWENAFDAAGVAHAVWDEPAVAAVRKMAA
jgi:hypothetical protein